MNAVENITHLLIIEDRRGKQTVVLESATCSIGRDSSNSIVLKSSRISRHHALLLRLTKVGSNNYKFRLIDGDLQGNRSTNGITVNGTSCLSHDLQHGDEIVFGDEVRARYYATVNDFDIEFLTSCEEEELSGFLPNLANPFAKDSLNTGSFSGQGRDNSAGAAMTRLASFPELDSTPIVEINLAGEITYLNPSAISEFPDLREKKAHHPIIAGMIESFQNCHESRFIREVTVGEKILEQTIHYIRAGDLIRSYLTDITERKKVESLLQHSYQELEDRVEERTNELAKINESLKAEIIEREKAEEELRLWQTITQAITEVPDVEAAIEVTLTKISETINWNCAEAWVIDPEKNKLRLSPAGYCKTHKFFPFREASQNWLFAPNEGVPGRVWSTQQPEWNENILEQSSKTFLRGEIAQEVGLKAALGVPLMANDVVIAIFVFFASKSYQANDRILDLVKSVTNQLGLIIEHKGAKDALQVSIATNRALLNAIPDWILRVNGDGVVINFKKGKANHPPLLTQEFLNKSLWENLPPEFTEPIMDAVTQAFSTNELQIVEYQLTRNGCSIYYEARITLSVENEVIIIVRDITKRKQVEQDMLNALEKERELNDLKSRFVTMTSHEFRTPLATILSSAELLQHYSHKWSEEKNLSHLQRIQSGVKRMTELLNDVLILGKAEAGKLEFNPTKINLAQVCGELVEEMQLTTSTHTIAFHPANSCATASIDLKLLRHILINLLSNAIKYSPQSDRVEFEVLCDCSSAIFRIRDQGIGISALEKGQLYNSFYRGGNVASIPGTGLGMTIVKKSVELHGGTIEVESEVNVGSTFTVTLPCQAPNSTGGNS
ncbi:MAG: ATP-binding protein [Cyanobacteria bacterium P01_G01_bin.49]